MSEQFQRIHLQTLADCCQFLGCVMETIFYLNLVWMLFATD